MLDRKRLKRLDRRYRRIARRLKRADLQRESTTEFDPDGVFANLIDKWSSRYFLGYYSEEGMTAGLQRYGFFEELAKRGLFDPVVRFDLRDPYLHRLTIHCDGGADPDTLLVDLKARVVHRPGSHGFDEELGDEDPDFLFVEWLLLQHPKRPFSARRLPLPGQSHPGLGIGYEVLELITIMAERLRLGGIVNVPMHYHNAVLYSPRNTFVDPKVEGVFRALRRDLGERPLPEASWAVYHGCVSEGGRPLEWEGHEQLCALRRRVRRYLCTNPFREARDSEMASRRFTVDEERLAALMADPDALVR